MSTYRILTIDEDVESWRKIQTSLESKGFSFLFAGGIEEGLQRLREDVIDLVLLDEAVPEVDFLDVIRDIKSSYTLPLFVISNKSHPPSKLTSLELGADDYVHKPIDIAELTARIKSSLKLIDEVRDETIACEQGGNIKALKFRNWILDFDRYELRELDGDPIDLTSGELDILMTLARSAGKVLSREQLFAETRGRESDSFDRAVDVQISRIRQRLNGSNDSDFIRTVRGVGYMLDVETVKILRSAD